MKALHRRPPVTFLLSTAIAAGTVIGIAATDRPSALLRGVEQMRPLWWLLWALAAELVAYAGYVVAYRSVIREPGRPLLSLALTVRFVVAGFGPFVPLGGFALDRRALSAVGEDARTARVHVLGLGVIEYMLLAPAAFVCALALYLRGDRASPLLTLPWILAVPPGFVFAWWATRPRVRAHFTDSGGRVRLWIADVLSGVGVMREVVLHPRKRPGALIGMGVYWASEIACFGFSLRCFGVHLSVSQLVVAYATGYAASRRSLPLGGAGVTEALLTLALIATHVQAVDALLGVIAYRVVNFVVPTLPGLLAHASIAPLLEGRGGDRD